MPSARKNNCNMKQTARAGKHDFRPNALPWPRFGDISEAFKVDFTPGAWYDTKHFACRNAWNKAGGYTRFLSANNRDSLLVAWRPSETFGHFEVCLYANDSHSEWKATEPLTMHVNDTAVAIFERKAGEALKARLQVVHAGIVLRESPARMVMFLSGALRRVGAWFGGRCPAPWDMEVWTGWSNYSE